MRKLLILLLVLAVLFTGCGTLIIHSEAHHPLIYAGVRTDLILPMLSPVGFIFLLDLPLSFVADTILLPFAIIFYDEHEPSIFKGLGGC